MSFQTINKITKKTFSGVTSPLIELCNAISDCPHYTPNWTASGKLVIRNYNIKKGNLDLSNKYYTDEETFKDRISRQVPEPGDLIITREAPMGEVCMIPEGIECCLGQRMVLIKPDPKKVNNRFLLYSLLSEYVHKQIKQSDTSGSIVSNLCIPDLEQLRIPVASLKEQDRIADILSPIDDKISLNNRINAELEQMAKTIYNYWFVQFDFPTSSAQADSADKPDEEGKPYKTSGGEMVWSEELKREVPRGWEVDGFDNLISEFISGDWGKESSTGNYTEKVTCIRGADIANFTSESLADAPTRYILEKNNYKILGSHSLIIEISGGSPIQSTGRIAYINEALLERMSNNIICSNFCRALKIKDNNYFYFFFETWSSLYDSGVLFNFEGKTTGIKNLLIDNFIGGYKIPIPQKDIVKSFNDLVAPMFKKIQKNAQENQELTRLRDFLLPLLMNGQVRVGEENSRQSSVVSL